jgi:hypothetical protein
MLIYQSMLQIWRGVYAEASSAGKDLRGIGLNVVVLRFETFVRDKGKWITGKRL